MIWVGKSAINCSVKGSSSRSRSALEMDSSDWQADPTSQPLWIAVPMTGDSPRLIVQPADDPFEVVLKMGLFTIH